MKAIISSVAFVCIVTLPTRAQQKHSNLNDERWTISVAGGAAIPVGKFASANIWDSTALFGKAGPVIEVTGSYRFNQRWSAILLVSGQQLATNGASAARSLDAAATNRNSFYGYNGGTWRPFRILAGAGFSLPVSKRQPLTFTARLMAGVLKVLQPERALRETPTDSTVRSVEWVEDFRPQSELKWQFAAQAGVGIQYGLGKRWLLQGGVDFAGSILIIRDIPMVIATHEYASGPMELLVPPTPSPTPMVFSSPLGYLQPLMTVNVTAGAGFRF